MPTGSYSETFGGGGWGGYGKYIRQKDARINQQLTERHTDGASGSGDFFAGCVFWLDGRTRIPEYKIKALMVKHGGQYESYDLSKVTHVVADNLAMGNKKWQSIRDRVSRPFHVVTTEWIQACIHKNRRIKESLFLPTALQNRSDGFGSIFRYVESEPNDSLMSSIPESPQANSEQDIRESPASLISTTAPITNFDSRQSPPNEEKQLEATSRLEHKVDETPGISKSGLGTDYAMDFVENFFKNSRLHFIGRWREKLLRHMHLSQFEPLPTEVVSVPLPSRGSSSSMLKFLEVIPSSTSSQQSEIIHVDFDAFFVSVALKKHPELVDDPVAVSHGVSVSDNSGSEISSCNYVARSHGVKKGMWIREAKKLCPHLKVLPYDFENIEKSSLILMDVLTEVTSRVIPMSCDEAYLQLVGEIETKSSIEVAFWIKDKVYERTGCRVSIGIGPNLIIAKLAGQLAKPSSGSQSGLVGVCRIDKFNSMDFMRSTKLSDIPGIGERALEKLQSINMNVCDDVLQNCDFAKLQNLLGKKLGETLWLFCHGCDPRPIPNPQHGVGDIDRTLTVSVNWGVRLTCEQGVMNFLNQMAQESEKRLADAEGSTGDLTLKILQRAPHAPVEPIKYGGCGECNELTNHKTLSQQIAAQRDIYSWLYRLWKQKFAQECPIVDIRGVTVVMAKLKRINDDECQKQSTLNHRTITTTDHPTTDIIKTVEQNRQLNNEADELSCQTEENIERDQYADMSSEFEKSRRVSLEDTSVTVRVGAYVKDHTQESKNVECSLMGDMVSDEHSHMTVMPRREKEIGISISRKRPHVECMDGSHDETGENKEIAHVDKRAKINEELGSRTKGSLAMKTGSRKGRGKKLPKTLNNQNEKNSLINYLPKKDQVASAPIESTIPRQQDTDGCIENSEDQVRDQYDIESRLDSNNCLSSLIQRLSLRLENDLNKEMLFVGILLAPSKSDDCRLAPTVDDAAIQRNRNIQGKEDANGQSSPSSSVSSDWSVVNLSVGHPVSIQLVESKYLTNSNYKDLNNNVPPSFETGDYEDPFFPVESSAVEFPNIEVQQIKDAVKSRIAAYENSSKTDPSMRQLNCRLTLTSFNHAVCLKGTLDNLHLRKNVYECNETPNVWSSLIDLDCWLCIANHICKMSFCLPTMQRYSSLFDFHNTLLRHIVATLEQQPRTIDSIDFLSSPHIQLVAVSIAQEIVGITSIFSYRRDLDIAVEFLKRSEGFWLQRSRGNNNSLLCSSEQLQCPIVNIVQKIGFCIHGFLVKYRTEFVLDELS